VDAYAGQMDALAFDEALKSAWRLVTWANRHIDESAPWNLAKDPARAGELDAVLYNSAEVLRLLSHLLAPVIPTAMEELNRRLGGVPGIPWAQVTAWGGLEGGTRIETGGALFPRLDKESVRASAGSAS